MKTIIFNYSPTLIEKISGFHIVAKFNDVVSLMQNYLSCQQQNHVDAFLLDMPLSSLSQIDFNEMWEAINSPLVLSVYNIGDLDSVFHRLELLKKLEMRVFLSSTFEDNYYGLGVSDMKGGTAALLEAVTTLPTDIPSMLCFTYDEEIGFKGINELIKSNIDLPDTLIFPEPTDLVPAIANKGCIEFSITFNGKSAHSSTPELGENALYKALDFIKELKAFASKLRKEKLSLYEVPYTTFNLSKINGGNEINKVPDTCEITFDFRTITKEHNKKILDKIEKLTKKYQGKANILNNLNAAVTDQKEVIEKIETITNKKAIGLNYVTEASFFPDKNIIILGPGPITAHQKDERIRKESLKDCIEIYRTLIIENEKINRN